MRMVKDTFQGVSIQPMVKFGDGYELIIGSSIDPQFGPCYPVRDGWHTGRSFQR